MVSATIGEGHNATAAAVEERARALWPGCVIRRVDTLEEMGRLTGPVFRWIYRVNVDHTPWLYDFFYRELWRRPWFASASCRFTGAWAGRALAPIVADFQPDLVVSTYPLGTGGLDWLRRRNQLEVPLAAIISDFAPHPFWVYSEVDLHYVASEPSLRAMWRARPDARGSVGAPPVVSAFAPADRAEARAALKLPADAVVVLISCGSLGFGSVERAVDAALTADPDICVVVTCGRNAKLRSRLAGRGEPEHRLVPLGWTDRMPELLAASDVVVTNAGGATALEALATGRAVLLFEPIAGHGKANAALMERAGLGQVCPDTATLTKALSDFLRDPERLAAAEQRALAHARSRDFDAEIAALPALPRHRGSRPLAPSDALFVATASPTVPQQVGALALLEPPQRTGVVSDPEWMATALRQRFAERAAELPMLRRRLWQRPGRWPRWLTEDEVDPAKHIQARRVDAASWDAAVREFFTAPVPLDRPPWQLRVLVETTSSQAGTGGPTETVGRRAVLVKLHHALGDGLAVTATLSELLGDDPTPNPRVAPPSNQVTGRPQGRRRVRGVRWTRLARGLLGLASKGRTPGGATPPSGAERCYALAELPAAQVRAVARSRRSTTTAVLLGVLSEAVARHGSPAGAAKGRLRAAVPLTVRPLRRGRADSATGNDTAAVLLDLPVGPLPGRLGASATGWRIDQVAGELNRCDQQGHTTAAWIVVRALGRLPAVPYTRLVRLLYGGRFFSMIASVMPGRRRELRILGARVASVYPVLPLADRVGLAVGFLSWGNVIGVGITADPALFRDAEGMAQTLTRVFGELVSEDDADGQS